MLINMRRSSQWLNDFCVVPHYASTPKAVGFPKADGLPLGGDVIEMENERMYQITVLALATSAIAMEIWLVFSI